MAKLSALVDDFTAGSISTTNWPSIGAGVTQSSGILTVPCTSTWTAIFSNYNYTFSVATATIKVVSVPPIGNGGTQCGFMVGNSAGDEIGYFWANGFLYARYTTNSTNDDVAIGAATSNIYWRVRQVTGWVYWETSEDGYRWTLRRSKNVSYGTSGIGMYLYSYYGGTESSPAGFKVDSVNMVATAPAARALDVGQSWDGTLLSQYTNQSAPTDGNGARVVQATVDGRNALSMKAYSTDVYPKTPNNSPRAQLVSIARMYEPGCVYRSEVEIKFPTGAFSSFSSGGGANWLQFVQWAYGYPFYGSGPLRLITRDGTNISLQEQDFTLRYTTAISWDGWMKFVLTQKFAKNGWYELRLGLNGATPAVVVPKRTWTTIYSSNDGGNNSMYLNTYFSSTTPLTQVGPIYFAGTKVTRIQEAHGVS